MGTRVARVLGVDACRGGWLGISLDPLSAYLGRTVAEVVAAAGGAAVVAVDIPIGLPDAGRRRADLLARQAVGPRWPSVFLTPVRPAVEADDYPEAARRNRRLAGEGFSVQAYRLRPRILEVDAWVRHAACRVVEVHPEVSFAAIAGAPLADSKTTWAGVEHRRRLLAGAGITLPPDLGEAGRAVGVADVLDAAVAAWSARRAARGEAYCLPEPPERFSDGHACAIWV